MSHLTLRQVASTSVLAIACALTATAANGATWSYATKASPQSKAGYGSTASTYGTWSGTRSGTTYTGRLISANNKFHDADDHAVFVVLKSAILTNNRVLGIDEAQTSHDGGLQDTWQAFRKLPKTSALMPDAPGVMTGTLKTCIDVPLRSDPCSAEKTSPNFAV